MNGSACAATEVFITVSFLVTKMATKLNHFPTGAVYTFAIFAAEFFKKTPVKWLDEILISKK